MMTTACRFATGVLWYATHDTLAPPHSAAILLDCTGSCEAERKGALSGGESSRDPTVENVGAIEQKLRCFQVGNFKKYVNVNMTENTHQRRTARIPLACPH